MLLTPIFFIVECEFVSTTFSVMNTSLPISTPLRSAAAELRGARRSCFSSFEA